MKSFRTTLAMSVLVLSCTFVGFSAEAQETDDDLITPAHTAEAYKAKARIYLSKATNFRKEAERHKEVARRFREDRDPKGRRLNTQADIREMEKRCKALSTHALTLAKDSEVLAEFYERHAKALEADVEAGSAKQ